MIHFLNRSLQLDYAGYHERMNQWKKRHIEFHEGELDESLTVKYAALWMNDQVYALLMEVKELMVSTGLYRHSAKHIYNKAWKEMERYNSLLRDRLAIDIYRFAGITQEMEDILKPHLDRLVLAISGETLSHGIGGDMGTLLAKTVAINMLCASNKAAVDVFRRETRELFGVFSDALDYLYMGGLNRHVRDLEVEIAPGLDDVSLTDSGKVMEAFNVFVRRLLDKGMFKEAIEGSFRSDRKSLETS